MSEKQKNQRKRSIALNRGIERLKQYVTIRSDTEDLLKIKAENDPRLFEILSNAYIVNYVLENRIIEANNEDKASLAWVNYGQRGTGKSFTNYFIAYLILKSRRKEIEWRKRIKFQTNIRGTIEIINTPSKWTTAIKELANEIEDIDEGSYWALLQDELDHEWGKDRIKQERSQKDAISNLRKLGLSIAFATDTEERASLLNVDFTLFQIGVNRANGMFAALLKFHRWQGIILEKLPKNILEFLIENYNVAAKKSVLDKARKGFFQETEKIEDEDAESENNDDRALSYDGDKFALLRDLFFDYWQNVQNVNITYARVLTAYLIYSQKLKQRNSNKTLSASKLTVDTIPWTQVAIDWDRSAGSFSQGYSQHKDKYEGYEDKITTHDKEAIGEEYAYRVLNAELEKALQNPAEYLNPKGDGGDGVGIASDDSANLAFDVRKQYNKSSYIVKEDGVSRAKAYDIVVLNVRSLDICAINHKLYPSNKRVGKFDEDFGMSPHPVSIIWYTWTRPYHERFFVKFNSELTGDFTTELMGYLENLFEKGFKKFEKFEKFEGLGTGDAIEVDFNTLLKIIINVLMSSIQF